jgi:hypothetical protein
MNRATILDVIDTPAYAAWRASFGFDEAAMKEGTTRSEAATFSPPPTPEQRPDADRRHGHGTSIPEPGRTTPAAAAAAQETRLPVHLHDLIARLVTTETAGAWTLQQSSRQNDWVRLRIQSGDRGVVDLEMGRAEGPDVAAYRILDGVAFRYLDTGYVMSKSDLRHLDSVARTLRSAAVPLTEQ